MPRAGRKAASNWTCWAKRITKSGSGRWPRRTVCATSLASPRFRWRRPCGAPSRSARTTIRHPCPGRKLVRSVARPRGYPGCHAGVLAGVLKNAGTNTGVAGETPALKCVTPGEEADDRLGVFDLALGDHRREFLALEPAGFDALVLHRSGLAGGEILGEEDAHALPHEAGARPERRQFGPLARYVAGLFLQFAPASRRPAGSSQRYFSAGRRYWRTSSTRFLSSTAIITALPMCRTTLRLIWNFVLGSTATSSVTRKRPQS